MTDSDKINLVLKIAGENLAQSRQWEQIGFGLLVALLTILGVVVANRTMFEGLSTAWTVASWASVALLLLSLALVSARYLLLSVLYFSVGSTRLNVANATARGDADHPIGALLSDRFLSDPSEVNMPNAAYHLAHLMSGSASMYAPLFLVAVAAFIVAAGQMTKAP